MKKVCISVLPDDILAQLEELPEEWEGWVRNIGNSGYELNTFAKFTGPAAARNYDAVKRQGWKEIDFGC